MVNVALGSDNSVTHNKKSQQLSHDNQFTTKPMD